MEWKTVVLLKTLDWIEVILPQLGAKFQVIDYKADRMILRSKDFYLKNL